MKKLIALALAAAASAFMAPTASHAADAQCVGSPDVPATYFCYVKMQIQADPTVTPYPVDLPSHEYELYPGTTIFVPGQPITIPAGHETVPSQSQVVPGFCVVVGCFEPVTVATPQVDVWTPGFDGATRPVIQEVQRIAATTPAVYEEIPLPGLEIGPSWLVTLYYKDSCYYVYPDGHVDSFLWSNPDTCP